MPSGGWKRESEFVTQNDLRWKKKEKNPDFKICMWLRKPHFYSPCPPCFDLSYSNFICTDPGSPVSMCNHEHRNPCWYSPHPLLSPGFLSVTATGCWKHYKQSVIKTDGLDQRDPAADKPARRWGRWDGMKDRSNLGVTIFFSHLQM